MLKTTHKISDTIKQVGTTENIKGVQYIEINGFMVTKVDDKKWKTSTGKAYPYTRINKLLESKYDYDRFNQTMLKSFLIKYFDESHNFK